MSTTAASAGIAASIAAAAESERTAASAEPLSMQAIHQDRYGTSEQLALTTVERPSPEAGQVLVKVTAAGVDRGVWHLMTGRPLVVRLGFGLRRPKQPVPGLDLAGTVVEVGANVSDFAVGDEVYGIGTGAYAEYAIAEVGKLAHRPDTVTAEQVANEVEQRLAFETPDTEGVDLYRRLANPEASMAKLCGHFGLPPDPVSAAEDREQEAVIARVLRSQHLQEDVVKAIQEPEILKATIE